MKTGEDNLSSYTLRFPGEILPSRVIRTGWLMGDVSQETWLQSRLSQDGQMVTVPVGTGSGQDSRKQNWHWVIEKMGYKIGRGGGDHDLSVLNVRGGWDLKTIAQHEYELARMHSLITVR